MAAKDKAVIVDKAPFFMPKLWDTFCRQQNQGLDSLTCLSHNAAFVGYDARLDAKTSVRGQAGSSVILAMTTRIPLYASTDRASIGAMSFLSGTIDAR